jgi:hypothetical protein
VQVVEDERDGPDRGDRFEQAAHRLERQVALPRAVGQAVGGAAHGEQPGQRAVLGGEPARRLPRRQVLEEVLEGLDPGAVRQERLLVAAPVEDGGAAGVQPAGQRPGQRGLADPGLPGDERDAERPGRGVRPGRLERSEGALAALGRRAARQRRGKRRPLGAGGSPSARGVAATADLVDEGARRRGRRDPELAPQALGEGAGGGEGRRPVAGAGEDPDELAVGLLRERLELRPPP